MIVRNIIAAKPTTEVVSVKPTDLVRHAAEVLSKHRIGAVIVTRDGQVVDGILSERDIVRALARIGPGCLDSQVQDLMTSSVIACRCDDTVHSVMEKMTDGRFRHMPVIEDGKMVGVISIGDVVKARMTEIEHENNALTDMIVGHG